MGHRVRAISAALVVMSGCAFADGNPWGIADVELDVVFSPAEGRATSDGWLKTSDDYEIDIETLRVEIDGVGVAVDTSGDAALGFDPANPPPGYSLCHNGHCHSADGRLVDYEDIERELAEGGGASGFVLRRPGSEVTIEDGSASVALGDCSSTGCWLERGSARSVHVDVHAVEVELAVRDARQPPRLAAPERWSLSVERELEIDTVIDEPIGAGEPLGLRVRARLIVPDELFDRIDFATDTATAVEDRLATSVSEHAVLETTIERFEP